MPFPEINKPLLHDIVYGVEDRGQEEKHGGQYADDGSDEKTLKVINPINRARAKSE
jgi:hypothetical protein